MWIEIICGLILYKLVKFLFYDDDLLELDTSDSSALFSVAKRLENVYGGKAFVGLKIPDADTASHLSIDVVLVTKSGALLVSVNNMSGFVIPNPDGSWLCESGHKTHHLPDPVQHLTKQASVLESYIEQRGLTLPPHYLDSKLVLANPKCSSLHSSSFPPQVMTYEQWTQLKPQSKPAFSAWMKAAFRSADKDITTESIHNKLNFILSTAPVWDRLELKGNKYVLGEFLDFKGNQEDLHALRNVKRSKVARILIQKTSMLGLAHSRLQVVYSPRDYRTQGASTSETKEVAVRSSTEVIFQPQNSNKLRKFKLSSIVSMSLSA